MDKNLSGCLSSVVEVKLLKEHGVEQFCLLDHRPLETSLAQVVYLVRPIPELMAKIANHIHDHREKAQRKEYFIYFVPRKTILCDRVLAETGVLGDVNTNMHEFRLDLIPLDQDLLSLELPSPYRDLYLMQDPSCLYYVARSLIKLQAVFGIIPRILGKGDHALHVFNLMKRMKAEERLDQHNSVVPEITQLVLLDRNVDMITPLMFQRTYEGLIDEVYGIRNGVAEAEIEVNPNRNAPAGATPNPNAQPVVERNKKKRMTNHHGW